jgi:serine/threonine protein kinase
LKKTGNALENQGLVTLLLNEVNCLAKVGNHKNIVQLKEFGEGVVEKPNGKSYGVLYVVMELIQGGEVYDFIANTGGLSEMTARYFFH